MIRGEKPAAPDNDAACREIGAGDDLAKLVDGDLGVVEIGDAGIDDLAEIVRRDIGRHADGNAARAVDEQVWKLRRQHHGLKQAIIVVGLEVHGLFVEIVEQRHRNLSQPGFCITFGSRRIAIDRAKVALAIDQRNAQRKFLRHTHERVVNREIAVRVKVAHDVADDLGRFDMLLVECQPQPVHGEQNAPVHRLQSVADIRQCARDDDAHRVVEI